ncbi:MAG TPA: polyprenyl synthetase family protein [Actinomycetota bacterium]|jgi:geranylgeranyl diphosphate synthase type I
MEPSYDELRLEIERALDASFDRAVERLPDAAPLIDELRRVTRAGGKRLRPAFCYWGHRAAGGAHGGAIVRASASLELLHTFAIVHDDIMDGSDHRRGHPTVNAAHGTSVALLTGDLALVLADEELMTSGFEPDALQRAFAAYSRMRQEVVAGQFLELRMMARAEVTEPEARRIAVLKSGRYSIQEPLLVGALLAGGSSEVVDGLGRAGDLLGEAFQVADDLLGTFGNASATGKPVDSDIRSGKRNVLYAKTLERLSGAERAVFVSSWGGGDVLSASEVDRLRGFVESSGARAATEALLSELARAARSELDRLPLEADARAALADLASRAVERQF